MKSFIKRILFSLFQIEQNNGLIQLKLGSWVVFSFDLFDRYYKRYYKKLKDSNEYVIINANFGEAYVVFKYFLPQLIAKNSDLLLILTKKKQIDLLKMFNIDCKYCLIENWIVDRMKGKFNYKNKKVWVLFNHDYYVSLEEKMKLGVSNYVTEMETFLGLKANASDCAKISVSEKVKDSVQKKLELLHIKNNKFVFILPEANTCSDFTVEELDLVVQAILKKGLKPVVNIFQRKEFYAVKGIKTCDLTVPECFEMASLSVYVIGVKSGLLEILSEAGKRTLVVAKPFKNRAPSEQMPVEASLEGFSARHLPLSFKVEEYLEFSQLDVLK